MYIFENYFINNLVYIFVLITACTNDIGENVFMVEEKAINFCVLEDFYKLYMFSLLYIEFL